MFKRKNTKRQPVKSNKSTDKTADKQYKKRKQELAALSRMND